MVKVHGSLTCMPVVYSVPFRSKLHERTVTAVTTTLMMIAVMAVTNDHSSCSDTDHDVLQYTSQSVRYCCTVTLNVFFYIHKISHQLVACFLVVN